VTVHFSMSEIVVLALLTGLVWHAIGIVAKTAALQFNAAVARKKDQVAEATKLVLAKETLNVWKEAEQVQQRMRLNADVTAPPAPESKARLN
jgi:hypothetical protein